MAKIGLKYPVYKTATAQGVIGKAIQADISITSNNVKLFADDGVAEVDNSFQGGAITLVTDDLPDTDQSNLLGHTVSDGELIASGDDSPADAEFGFYGKKIVNKVKKWRAIWLTKVQFAEPADSNATKGDTTAFGTSTMTGEIMRDDNGVWKKEKTFATEADAIAYLNTKAGIPVAASGGLTALSLTGTGGALSPAFCTGIRYYTFDGVTAASVTVTATAVAHVIKLYVDGVLSQTLITATPSAAIAMAVGAKKLTIVAQEAGKASQTTEIIVVKTA